MFLKPDRVADAAPHPLAVRRVRDAAGQLAEVEPSPPAASGSGIDASSSSSRSTGAGPSTGWPVGRLDPGVHRVPLAQLDRVDAGAAASLSICAS